MDMGISREQTIGLATIQGMPADQFIDPTGRDQTRQIATDPDHDYSLTVEEAADRYAGAGHPRTLRTVQRYCAKGHLDCQKVATAIGDKYLVAPYSIARHIGQINEVIAFTTSRDASRPIPTAVAAPLQFNTTIPTATAPPDLSRQGAADRGDDGKTAPTDQRYVTQLERENGFLRDQIQIKDTQIGELSERARETNVLIKGLQDLFLRLQPGRSDPPRIHPQSSEHTIRTEPDTENNPTP